MDSCTFESLKHFKNNTGNNVIKTNTKSHASLCCSWQYIYIYMNPDRLLWEHAVLKPTNPILKKKCYVKKPV